MKKLVVIFALFAFWACGDSAIEKPKNLIDEDKMVDIFYDLSLLDAIRSHNPGKLQSAKDPNLYIYKKYKVDSVQFAQSNRYYASDIAKYKKMYQRVGRRLERNKNSLDSLVNKGKPVQNQKLPEGGMVK
ncbi:MAG: DUF4296 domain-containing protein [Flavobacterium sp.]|uniref:DUF4296 domain-containing protein n=1 Tax=Flavobacterium sp. TaxID=239 RepID=UPI0011FEA308|nr:DUF4296 domain-containing protein [Flavobacterium sp.]RZJ68618.1 MAG: DUF4296 domain-containing protein [Flavobacterium sp.]